MLSVKFIFDLFSYLFLSGRQGVQGKEAVGGLEGSGGGVVVGYLSHSDPLAIEIKIAAGREADHVPCFAVLGRVGEGEAVNVEVAGFQLNNEIAVFFPLGADAGQVFDRWAAKDAAALELSTYQMGFSFRVHIEPFCLVVLYCNLISWIFTSEKWHKINLWVLGINLWCFGINL